MTTHPDPPTRNALYTAVGAILVWLAGSLYAPAAHSRFTRRFDRNGAIFETIKVHVLARLDDRLGPSASKRMPASLLYQSLRTFAEQITEQEARTLSRSDRDRLLDEVIAEFLGYGPLVELFKDVTVCEVLVAGPQAVIVRRLGGHWLPTSVKFRDEEHLTTALERLATHAEAVGPVTTSVSFLDMKLPNGFRVVCVLPPPALGQSPTAAFVRTTPPTTEETLPQNPPPSWSRFPAVPGSPIASPRPGSNLIANPSPRTNPLESPTPGDRDPLSRHRNRIIERLISKLASLGVYDIQRVDIPELRKAVAAYIDEYCTNENFYLSDTDRGRLLLEIMAAMER